MVSPIKPCPTPEKHAYRTRAEALNAFAPSRGHTLPHAAYRCCCGKWHLTTKRFRRR